LSDVFTKKKRSEVMARIRSTGNRDTELAMVALLRAAGITGWRRGQKLPGRPDFVFRKERVLLFVDGCFWHWCPKHGRLPRGNGAFWRKKLEGNRARDRLNCRLLQKLGWRVLRVWEHELTECPERCMGRVRRALRVTG
jgi:DNA mismatch endonuclease (patch repair protein)